MQNLLTTLTAIVILYVIQSKSEYIPPPEIAPGRRQGSPADGLLPGWTSVGCFTDQASERTLLGPMLTSTNMTPAVCMGFCNPGDFGFAGVEFSKQCFCDFVIQDFATQVDASQCNDTCAGVSPLTCGGSNRISIFANLQSNVIHPSNKPFVGPWEYKGCFTDSLRGGRNLQRMVGLSGPVSVETCTAACKASNFILAGLENADECWCGNVMNNGVKTPDADCGSACSGDPTEFCGSAVPNGGPSETFRQTIYQDTSVAIPFQTCLDTGAFFFPKFNIFSQTTPSTAIGPLLVVSDATFPADFFIFSGCGTCPSATVVDYEFEGGAITAVPSFPLSVAPQTFSVNVGDSPTLRNTIIFQQPAGFSGYCGMANPLNPLGPLFQPLLLGANSRADLWALCPNITASGRLDVVFSPVDNNPHYVQSDCEAVFIQMDSS